ncbi:MAG: ABC-type peptide/nickel transporter ATP-binding protein [Polyangiaceae bacterium]|jgi:peptide/nickel transport system ATP-binding protein|nr:ABC-type peptide/nickel transporter ATP-binding protein [Polyangiaceae bacterium]
MPSENIKFEASGLTRVYGHGKKQKLAVNDVSFKIFDKEIVSVVGQSGCGKTVLAKMLLRLEKPTSGSLLYDGRPIESVSDPRQHWRQVQAVFQDPFSCFNQFFTIRSQLRSAFNLFEQKPSEKEIDERVDQALLNVNIKPRELDGKYPFELSGGQMQRMLLARIFILRPRVLVADEPTSMVDACSRANILDYLMKLKEQLDMTIVFITHDVHLASYVSNRIFIMHEGRIVEQASPEDITGRPQDAVTKKLLDDIPDIHKTWIDRHAPA